MADKKDEKIPVVIAKVVVAKTSDKKLNGPAADALTAAMTAAVKKPGKLTVGSVSGKDKGFQLDATIHELTLDGDTLSGRLEIQLSTLPGPKMFSNAKGKSKFAGINTKKIDKEVADLIDEIMKTTGNDIRKGLEDKIEGM